MLVFRALIKYSETCLLINEEFQIDKDVPIIVMGDFNVDVKRNEKAFGFMKKHFDLNLVPTNYPSTLGNSYVDSTFIRNKRELRVTSRNKRESRVTKIN
ncbi:hypothetical protein AVEN_21296-1 [Araneus ventricosus]|uniref:Endonuclease/exonuclease/phosphatase domain-containing protein n=1 Tax=Araneus ventricosus TaxID=182803 RepID=A0A4Y2RC21_ARAVE|nr:hypothetical protein AVEN_21296-1 [Araneus ventricosus]